MPGQFYRFILSQWNLSFRGLTIHLYNKSYAPEFSHLVITKNTGEFSEKHKLKCHKKILAKYRFLFFLIQQKDFFLILYFCYFFLMPKHFVLGYS